MALATINFNIPLRNVQDVCSITARRLFVTYAELIMIMVKWRKILYYEKPNLPLRLSYNPS